MTNNEGMKNGATDHLAAMVLSVYTHYNEACNAVHSSLLCDLFHPIQHWHLLWR